MKFLVDECTGPMAAKWLASLGHDVYSVYDETPGMPDEDVLSKAVAEERVLITNDKDFGEMIFRERRPHKGVVFLRLTDERTANKIAVIKRVLENYAEKLTDQFVTVTERRIRFG